MRKQGLIADFRKGTARRDRTRKDGIQMKKVLMMIQESCPYCRQALRMMDELKAERPEFQAVEVKIVDENRPTVDKVRKVYERALDLGEEGREAGEFAAD